MIASVALVETSCTSWLLVTLFKPSFRKCIVSPSIQDLLQFFQMFRSMQSWIEPQHSKAQTNAINMPATFTSRSTLHTLEACALVFPTENMALNIRKSQPLLKKALQKWADTSVKTHRFYGPWNPRPMHLTNVHQHHTGFGKSRLSKQVKWSRNTWNDQAYFSLISYFLFITPSKIHTTYNIT